MKPRLAVREGFIKKWEIPSSGKFSQLFLMNPSLNIRIEGANNIFQFILGRLCLWNIFVLRNFDGTFKILVWPIPYTAYCRSACIQVEVPNQLLHLQWLLEPHLQWLLTAVTLEMNDYFQKTTHFNLGGLYNIYFIHNLFLFLSVKQTCKS